MNTLLRTRAFVLLLAAASLPASAEVVAVPDRSRLRADVDRLVTPLERESQLSGTLLIAEGDTVLYEKAWGMADYELGTPNTAVTRHNVASVTKSLTYITAIRLIEQGTISADDPVSKWIPHFPRGNEITIDMLLRHRSGVPHRVTDESQESVPRSAEEMVNFAKGKELLFPPGTARSYSSAGYSVLARILEIASGKTYARLLEEYVFAPAGAIHSKQPTGRDLIEHRALSYFHDAEGPVRSALTDLSFLVGAGSVYSTARDIFTIQRAVVQGLYGDEVRKSLVGKDGVRWNGLTNGYRAFVDYYAESDITIAFTGNLFTGAADVLRSQLPRLLMGETVETPVVPSPEVLQIDPDQWARIEGSYRLGDSPVRLRFETARRAALGSWILVPVGTDRFYSPQDWTIVTVKVGESGIVEGLQWGEGPYFPRTGD